MLPKLDTMHQYDVIAELTLTSFRPSDIYTSLNRVIIGSAWHLLKYLNQCWFNASWIIGNFSESLITFKKSPFQENANDNVVRILFKVWFGVGNGVASRQDKYVPPIYRYQRNIDPLSLPWNILNNPVNSEIMPTHHKID